MVMNIHEFVEHAKEVNLALYRNQSASEVLMKSRTQQINNWGEVFRRGGYFKVTLRHHGWSKVHDWCKEYIGEHRYTWTGSDFWFETEKDAAWFALVWS